MDKVNENASLNFKWLKKGGVGKNKDVQYYDSFIYDGVKYVLYDCVYMYNGDLRKPYIGKLIRIWERPDKTKKVKIHWFFRPEEISKWLRETKTLENEIFFATGEGFGLANINPMEAIIGLCNVVCVSKDNRNPQPSNEQLKAADFVFYRTFDVQSCAILDKMDDKVGGLEIKYVFNREESEKINPFLESASNTNEENPSTFISSETQQQKDDAKIEPQNKAIPTLLERNTSFTESDKSHDRPLKKIKSDDKCVEPGVARRSEKMMDMPSMKSIVVKADKGEMEVGIVPVERMENKERIKRPTGSDKLCHQPLKRFKSDDKKPPEEKPVELEVAHDSERYMEMSSKKSEVDSKSKNLDNSSKKEDKSPADVNNLKASETCGTTAYRKNSMTSEKVTSVGLEGKKLKKTRDDGSFKLPDDKMRINTDVRDLVALSNGKSKSGESKKELSGKKLLKVPALLTDKDKKNVYREFVVRPKLNSETSSWFKRLRWEEGRLENAYDQGMAILLHNVDPDYNSGEVEDIILHAFKEKCDAKILQKTSVSSPHYAQALVLLKTKEAAQKVLKKLDEKCLMLSNGRPLVATPCPPISTKKNIFFGHLSINKARFQNQHEDEAVSTSHFSQPNTIEYEMAMDWCFLQLTSMKSWEKLHEQQGLELENLKNDLKKDCA